MSTAAVPLPLIHRIAARWSRLVAAPDPEAALRLGPIELDERTLDDIGAPEWLRTQARIERGGDEAWLLGRQSW